MVTRQRRSWFLALVLGACALLPAAVAAPPVTAGNAIDCSYTQSNHRVKVTITGEYNVDLDRSGSGVLLVNNIPCPSSPTISNTDSIVILAGAGHQVVTIFLGSGGFKPGFTDEPGNSDEIEISVSLGGDNDALALMGGSSTDHVVMGKSTGLAVQGRANLNPSETTGIDADLTIIIGVEDVYFFGRDGSDTFKAGGGSGTGAAVEFPLLVDGGKGGDSLTGGNAADHMDAGSGQDVLKGGPGADTLNSVDGVHGNDQILGGTGADTCTFDSGDTVSSC